MNQLRERRESALRARQNGNGRPPLLPSRPVLAEVVNGLAAALFPHRLGRPDLCIRDPCSPSYLGG